jgi:ABC-type phosphate transport system permease subunit
LADLLGGAKDSSGLSFIAEPMGDGGLSVPGAEDQRLVCKVTVPGEPTRRLIIRRLEDGRSSVEAFREHSILLADMVRFFPTNRLGIFQRLGVYASRWWEFLSGDPREAGMEGGFFPAIWGTVVMTIVMSLAVMPFGVLAALYMREYAKSGWLLSVIRISINNLAGVPSIVYGVFGLSFFCYIVGGYIDGGPVKAGFEPWPSAAWFSALGGLAIVGLIAFAVSIFSGQAEARRSPLRTVLRWSAGLLWLLTLGLIVWLLVKSPHFHGFYEAQLPNPTFGKGCLLWAALTLSLLTLPVVIVATEEALSAVPNSLREGSYACGAGKWQTIHRIVLPYARPGIITGFILAMARGAGEVAPMMLVGAIPLATELPLDGEFPFLHGSRSFMHLGFQIYSLGFQSQNSEAAKPMVFTATLLLLTIVTVLNQTAIWLRASLRKRFQTSQF